MPYRRFTPAPVCGLLLALSVVQAQDPPPPKRTQQAAAAPAGRKTPTARFNAQRLAASARKSLVAVSVVGRDGRRQGLGTGFVISADGLIATNLHVIGEARPIRVQFADDREFDVTEVHASDRALDLAIVKIDAEKLPALPLGEASKVEQGMPVVALGNPQGLKYSVVGGVVSGSRELEGRRMLQLAMPVEPGNSGGPVLDAAGRVVGVVTMKSLVTENLGFALAVDDLKPLLAKPNPVPMDRWMTIGALDRRRWRPLLGARWRRQSGRIVVDGAGAGFGGRSLCVFQQEPPEPPYEVGVNVRLDDDAGAAGLIFHSDGGDRHYGFYPTAGKLRLTRFDGPNVFTWKVLHDVASPHYRSGQWNYLKVRVEDERLQCFLNDQLVIESKDDGFRGGKPGLAKFRHTRAEFKQFRVAGELPASQPSADIVTRLRGEIERIGPLEQTVPGDLAALVREPDDSVTVIRRQAVQLQQRADELLKIAADVHTAEVVRRLAQSLPVRPKQGADRVGRAAADDGDLLQAALLIARLDDDEVDVDAYLAEVDQMAAEIESALPESPTSSDRLAALDDYLFKRNGFHGSRTDYYHRANSYLNRVIDDREGLPITLSVLYMELAARLGLRVVGVGLPGHFVVRHEPQQGKPQLIDVFDRGARLTRVQADAKVRENTGRPLVDEHLQPNTKRQIIKRMLFNLQGVAGRTDDREAGLRYQTALVALDPADVQHRGLRAVYRFQTGRRAAALADIDWILDRRPDAVDLDELRRMRDSFADAPLPTTPRP